MCEAAIGTRHCERSEAIQRVVWIASSLMLIAMTNASLPDLIRQSTVPRHHMDHRVKPGGDEMDHLLTRELSANRLPLTWHTVRPRHRSHLNTRRRLQPTPPCASAATLGTARSSGWTCKASTTSRSFKRNEGGDDRRVRPADAE